jgi:4'-phosphopantetheinyl transferase
VARSQAACDAIPLAKREIHLWLAHYDHVDDGLRDACRSVMSAEELAQEPRFFFARDRLRYVVTRWLARTVLSRYLPVEPTAWHFSTNDFGRPAIDVQRHGDTGLTFNISHTHSLIVLGVACERALGVDVENVVARKAALGVADRFFAPAEVAALFALPEPLQHDAFFEYWTFKESYIKARGMGLSLPLDRFGFRYPDASTVAIDIDPELEDCASRWQLWQFRPTPAYLVAVCAERTSPTVSIAVREVFPPRHEAVLAPTYSRRSD